MPVSLVPPLQVVEQAHVITQGAAGMTTRQRRMAADLDLPQVPRHVVPAPVSCRAEARPTEDTVGWA